MAARITPICAWCGKFVAKGEHVRDVVEVVLQKTYCTVLRWHLRPCAETDPIHLRLAEALSMPDGADGDEATTSAYLDLVHRIRDQWGPRGLRGAVDIRRDEADPRWTMRGAGELWGLRSRK